MIEQALIYAGLGWRVFPLQGVDVNGECACGNIDCPSPGKHPLTIDGFRSATTDAAIIEKWFPRDGGERNIAIATGHRSHIWVLDVDPKHGGNESLDKLVGEHGSIGSPLICRTGGGGAHYYYSMPDDLHVRSRVGIFPGLDARGLGGYVVAPPSVHQDGIYVWDAKTNINTARPSLAPKWLLDIVGSRTQPAGSGSTEHSAYDIPADPPRFLASFPQNELDELVDALDMIDNESRENWLAVGMALHSIDPGLAGKAAWEWWSKRGNGAGKFNQIDQEKTWAHFRRGGKSIRSIFYLAQEAGWINPLACPDEVEEVAGISGNVPGTIPEAPTTTQVPQPIIPEATLAPPGILGDIENHIFNTAPRPQRTLAQNSAICLCGTVLGQKVASETGLRTNIYALSIGQSGAGKDHPRKTAGRILDAAGLYPLMGGEEFSSGSAVMSMMAAGNVRLCQMDEFGKVMVECMNESNSLKQSMLRKLMTLFSSADTIVLGNEMSTLSAKPGDEQKRKDVAYPHLSLHLTTVMDSLAPALTSDDVFSGFLNRILISMSDEVRPQLSLERKNQNVPQHIIDWIHAARSTDTPDGHNVRQESATSLVGVVPSAPRILSLNNASSEVINQFNDYTYNMESSTAERGLDALWGRSVEHAIKLSMIASASMDPLTRVITQQAMLWACEYVDRACKTATHMMDRHVADSPFQGMVRDVFFQIDEAGEEGVSLRDLNRLYPMRKLKPRDRSEILQSLGDIGVVQTKTAPLHGGKTSVVLIVPDGVSYS